MRLNLFISDRYILYRVVIKLLCPPGFLQLIGDGLQRYALFTLHILGSGGIDLILTHARLCHKVNIIG